MIYEPCELITVDAGISIKTNEDLQYAVRHNIAVERYGKPVSITALDEIRYDGHFVTEKNPRAWSK